MSKKGIFAATMLGLAAVMSSAAPVWAGRGASLCIHLDAKTLMMVALDPKVPNEERRCAVYAVGRLRTRESLELLAEHIELFVPVILGRAENWIRESPCLQVLRSTRDPRVIPIILAAIHKPRCDEELSDYAFILNSFAERRGLQFDLRVALLAAQWELVQRSDPTFEKNLAVLRDCLKHPR